MIVSSLNWSSVWKLVWLKQASFYILLCFVSFSIHEWVNYIGILTTTLSMFCRLDAFELNSLLLFTTEYVKAVCVLIRDHFSCICRSSFGTFTSDNHPLSGLINFYLEWPKGNLQRTQASIVCLCRNGAIKTRR